MSDRLKEIAERAEKATPGPWYAELGDVVPHQRSGWERLKPTRVIAKCLRWNRSFEDAAFIAAAREDVPFLLAEVDRLQRALTEMCEEHGHMICVKYKGAAEFSCPCGKETGWPPLYPEEWKKAEATR